MSAVIKPYQKPFPYWLATARPGEVYEYHRGLLMADREPPDRPSPSEATRAMQADMRGATAAKAADEGEVALRQRRHAEFDWSYQAVKL